MNEPHKKRGKKMDRRLVIILGIFLLGSGYILFNSLSDGNVPAEKKTASLIIGAPAKILHSLNLDDTGKDSDISNNAPSTPKLGKATGGSMGGGSMGGGSSSPQGGNSATTVPPASDANSNNSTTGNNSNTNGNNSTTNSTTGNNGNTSTIPGTGNGTGTNVSNGNQTITYKPVNITKINNTTYTFDIEIVVV